MINIIKKHYNNYKNKNNKRKSEISADLLTIKRLKDKNALCVQCEELLKDCFKVYIYENKEDNYRINYTICKKCEDKNINLTEENLSYIFDANIEKIEKNMFPYACEMLSEFNIDGVLNKKAKEKDDIKINAFKNTTFLWHKEDSKFFKNNPSRRFYARPLYEGEIEKTNEEDDNLKKEAIKKNISFAIIHNVANGQRLYSYTNDLSNLPYKDELYIAAIFLVRTNDLLKTDDIDFLYEELKTKKMSFDNIMSKSNPSLNDLIEKRNKEKRE